MFRSTTALAVLAMLSCIGCGRQGTDGEGTYHVSGTVSFAGKPIPVGKIHFAPDGAKGNSGPSGYATIKDGKFDTNASDGKPTLAGPSIVRIEGFDPSQSGADPGDTSGEVTVKALFPGYQTTADLPKEKTSAVMDFEVPAEAANQKSGGSI